MVTEMLLRLVVEGDSCLGAGDCGGKFGITALVATKKWNSGGKQSGCAKFATKVELEKLVVAWRLVIVVANLRLLL